MALTELAGRVVQPGPTATIYRIKAIGGTYSDAPTIGSTLSNEDFSHSIDPICVAVAVDEVRYPQKYFVQAVYEAPRTRAEI